MLDFDDARTQLLARIQLTPIQTLPLLKCGQRFLAQDIYAQFDSPPFTNSAMDGYALHIGDYPLVSGETPDVAIFELIDDNNRANSTSTSTSINTSSRIAAGDSAQNIELQPNQAIRIFTGAPLPKGCNSVIPQEYTQQSNHQLHCTHPPQLNANIRIKGEDFVANQILMTNGSCLTPQAIGLLASQGYAELPVHAPLRVTVFSTGDELIEPGASDLTSGKIFDANRYQLLSWLQLLHCTVIDGGILADDLVLTQNQLIDAAQNCDLIITSGGASVGQEDHLKAAVTAVGQLTQWKLAIKPGKPFAWGQVGTAQVMMLPGNPVATFVTFKLLVEPLIQKRMGRADGPANGAASHPYSSPCHSLSLSLSLSLSRSLSPNTPIFARTTFKTTKPETRREFLRGTLWFDQQGTAYVNRLSNQGSHMLSACVQANCLIEIVPNACINLGDLVAVHL